MNHASDRYRVLVPTALFGTVRVSKGDVVRRELLGCAVRKLVEDGVIEPAVQQAQPVKSVQASLM